MKGATKITDACSKVKGPDIATCRDLCLKFLFDYLWRMFAEERLGR